MNIISPAIWLIVLIVGLPQLSETVYTPSLPDIAYSLNASESMVEYTLTIYLLGFAVGTMVWGRLSDRVGRKPCVLAGLIVFIVGCAGCYYSGSIESLLASRFVQAFGGGIGSVLGQAICRDSFHGSALGKAYSSIGSALALFPAIGPVIGGFIAEKTCWSCIFLFLGTFGAVLFVLVAFRLPETHHPENRLNHSIWSIAVQMAFDKRPIGLGLIVAACNGILFSYFAEGSFYLINMLSLSPSQYGMSFCAIAFATMLGGMYSRYLHNSVSSVAIMNRGIMIVIMATAIFSGIILLHGYTEFWSNSQLIAATILCQMVTSFGICIIISNALALALVDYKHALGTASSLFGFFYYCFISLFTFFMGVLHNGTLLPMPLYFLSLGIFMFVISKLVIMRIQALQM